MTIILVLTLAFLMVMIVTSSFVVTKKRDIAIMKSLGSIPRKLYSFYLSEVYISFFIGFGAGALLGFISFLFFNFFMINVGFVTIFQFDLFFTPLLFFSCFFGIFLVSGAVLRKIGNQSVIQSFSKDIPYDYNASKMAKIPRWLTSLGYNIKISIINTTRRVNEFKRYFIVFLFISLIIFTLGLGTLVMGNSAKDWIRRSQGSEVVIIAHQNLVYNYSNMYEIFSNPGLNIENQLNFIENEYVFNFTEIKGLENFTQIIKIDERLMIYSNYRELDGYFYYEDGGYEIVGQQRQGMFPIIGINSTDIIQNFEIEGEIFDSSNSFDMMIIGDGLAYNFFDYPFDQSTRIDTLNHNFHISGVIIDTFYSGFSGYIDLSIMREDLNFSADQVNLVLLKLQPNTYSSIKTELRNFVSERLGSSYIVATLSDSFQKNINFIDTLSMIPGFIIIILGIISLLSLYNYQKSGIIDKAKDFLIMRSIGSKYRNVKRILFLESTYVIIPALFLSQAIGMILNSFVLFQRVKLPSIIVPFTLILLMMITFLIFNYLSLYPLMKKIKKFSIKDFEIY